MSTGAHPTVSVVVPTYNNAPFIEETIGSILAQTYPAFELIISDHSSDDGTWELLQRFRHEPRVQLLRLPRSDRPDDNWAQATAAASGDLLKLVCGDDVLMPNCLEVQARAISGHPDVVMVASRRDVVTACGDVMLRGWGLPGMLGPMHGFVAVRRAVALGTNPFGEPACVLLRRELLDDVGGWDGSFPYVLDQHTYSKVLMRGRFVGLPDVLAQFRVSEGQWSQALAAKQFSQVRDFHRALALDYPGVLTRYDLVRGRARAKLLAYARRLAYVSLSRQFRVASLSTGRGARVRTNSNMVEAARR